MIEQEIAMAMNGIERVRPSYEVLVTTAGGAVFVETLSSECEVRCFCEEEVKWETTLRVECPAFGIDWPGDFARFAS